MSAQTQPVPTTDATHVADLLGRNPHGGDMYGRNMHGRIGGADPG